ncbi:transposase (fragment) [Desulfamplus magnetovallimortis]|uniref:Transposase n=1 Tax=Desulfamplus magnetovallimortis TaxID=1246637 RepID=A0A1W1HCK4_9BACT
MTLNEETVRKWLYRYKHHGFPGLEDKTRSDEGKFDIPKEVAEALFELRKEHPRWTTAQMIRHLAANGIWNGKKPSRSSFYRFVQSHNLNRDPHLETHAAVKPFAFDHFGQLWLADFMHGPKVWTGKKKKKSILHVVMDDSTRYIVPDA